MDAEYLVNEWINKHKRFSKEKLLTSRADVIVTATNTSARDTRWFSSKTDEWETFKQGYRASCYQPIACTKTELIDGDLYVDGYVYAAIPVNRIQEYGVTDLIVARSQPKGYQKHPTSKLIDVYEKFRLKKFSPEFREDFANRFERYNKTVQEIETGFAGKVNTLSLYAPQELMVGNLETSGDKINDCFHNIAKLFRMELSKEL